jgi:acyl-CoA thioesterase
MTTWNELMTSAAPVAGRADTFSLRVGEEWLQGRTLYGGIVAALGLGAMEQAIEGLPPVLSTETVFMSPLPAGAITIEVRLLRRGRNVAFAEALIGDGNSVTTRVTAVFGAARPSSITVPVRSRQPSKPLDASFPIPFIPGITPAFTRQFESRLSEGGFPFTGSDDAATGGYLRFLDDPGSGATAQLGLLDAFPAPILPVATAPFMASTVRWSVHFLQSAPVPKDGFWWFRADALAAADGYATSLGTLQSDGVVVAWAEQLVAVFDQPSS